MKQLMNSINLKKTVLFGALGYLIALGIILSIILSVNQPKPEWGNYWYIKPLIVTPLIGGIGGLAFYFGTTIKSQNYGLLILRTILSIIVFLFFLWTGTILGLDGTLWN